MLYLILVLFVCTFTNVYLQLVDTDGINDEWWEVDIAQGRTRGRLHSNGELYVFYNIPYATAPTGKDKCKAPLPPPKWEETFLASDEHVIICPQFIVEFVMPKNWKMQEDCLIANIYVPNTKSQNLPVLVSVHGGGYHIGYGEMAKFTNLMRNKDIIIVTFNYRLGIHGFLCLGTEDIPGNAGMKDQVALLKWVQNNIASFGGNPNDVTIGGYSAGSSSVDLLMISKAAEGLFHKVIPESGANTAVFTMQSDPLQIAKNHAKTLNLTDVDNIDALEELYKSLSFDILTADTFMNRTDSTFLFSPCVEHVRGNDSIFTDSPLNILQRGKKNIKKCPCYMVLQVWKVKYV